MRTCITLAAAAAALVSTAAAQNAYGDIGLAVNEGFDDLGVVGRLGYDFNATFAAEGEVSYFNVESFGGDFDVMNFAGFVKGSIPAGGASIYGRLGYGIVKVFDLPDGADDTADDFAFGGGAEFPIGPRSGIRVDYTRYEAVDEGFFSVGYAFTFGQ
jgi:hypothetical protein